MKARVNSISNKANLLIHIFFIFCVLACIYPLLLVIGVSFTDEKSIVDFGYSAIPHVFNLKAYQYIISTGDVIGRAYAVTIFVTVVGTVLATSVTALFAYPISRKEFTHRKFFSFFLLFILLFNGGLVPWYVVNVQVLHINDTIWALILPSMINAWNIIILRTFFKINIPDAIIESARIDGSGEIRTFLKIVLPLSLPGLATIALFNTLGFWNDWWLPLMLINHSDLYNLQFLMYKILMNLQYLTQLQTQVPNASGQFNQLPSETARMAMCIVSIGPIILAYPFFQKYFVKGLTIGAVKG